MKLNDFDTDMFLRDYWQKKPLLIRNPWMDWENPLPANELAGLACEAEIESRLIVQDQETWTLEHGPFADTRFGALGETPWTLLVQAVDHYIPEVAALLTPFRFIPSWRIDDVMVSYASDGGGVGPHFDQYDVFLIQGSGRRRWQIGGPCDETSALLPHDDLRLLAGFEAAEEWICEPGDVLYIPPGCSHNGVAVSDDCMTYSIGFRAPSQSELIGDWCDDLLAELQSDPRYSDPDFVPQDNPGEITGEALGRLHAMLTENLNDRQAFAHWFGQYNSTRKYPDIDWRPGENIEAAEVQQIIAVGASLIRNPASRFSFIRQDDGGLQLFVDGKRFACAGETAKFAEQLCSQDDLAIASVSPETSALITKLYNQGSVTFE